MVPKSGVINPLTLAKRPETHWGEFGGDWGNDLQDKICDLRCLEKAFLRSWNSLERIHLSLFQSEDCETFLAEEYGWTNHQMRSMSPKRANFKGFRV